MPNQSLDFGSLFTTPLLDFCRLLPFISITLTSFSDSFLKPTLLACVRAILDCVRDGVSKLDATSGLSKKFFNLAHARQLSAVNGSWFRARDLERLLWIFLVFRKIRAIMDDRVRFVLSGDAPLSADRHIDIRLEAPIGQGYGLIETCAGGTFSEVNDTSIGRVDLPEGGYLTIDSPLPRREIVVGGPNVTVGYFKNEEKTKEVYKVDEKGMRWFYTGDIGKFHAHGCLEIIDHKKRHSQTSAQRVEAALSVTPNIMIHADPLHSSCVAVVVAWEATIEDWAPKQGIKYADFSD
ncbi:hypothetical protein ACH5RR_034010 [Cinchona calisaya]|uniref:AMP-dependent synthetase/ligase domain-containing protein n=1 Tax=Cinchona calisaya TaxID=153742 RepID=A0ABD2YDE0_9GENT